VLHKLVVLRGALKPRGEGYFTLEKFIGVAALGFVESAHSLAAALLVRAYVKLVDNKVTNCLAHGVLLDKLKRKGAEAP
jgi:hypothetical protein